MRVKCYAVTGVVAVVGWISLEYPDFEVLDGCFGRKLIVLRIASLRRGNHCPTCRTWTERVHSTRYRTVQDVPMCGCAVVLRVRTRKLSAITQRVSRRYSWDGSKASCWRHSP
ncbi:MAG: transposase family protein [Alicyclobacillus sp.]|nr:transposase family protein [Alicyclobacillus sp.]